MHYADATWDADRIIVVDDETSQIVAEGPLEWVDPDDDSTTADDQRRQVIDAGLSTLGWEPVPHSEWVDIDGGLNYPAGAVRVPVQQVS